MYTHDRNSSTTSPSPSSSSSQQCTCSLLPQSYHSLGRWILFLLGIAGLSTCHLDDLDREIPYAPVFVAPVGELTYTGRALFEKLMTRAEEEHIILEEDPQGLLRFAYVWDTTFYFNEQLPRVINETSDHSIMQPEDMPVLPTEQSFERRETQYSTFTLDNNRMDSIFFIGGELTMQVISTYPPEIHARIILPTLQSQNSRIPLDMSFDFVYEDNLPPPQDQTQIYSLLGYKLAQTPTATGNRFETQYRLRSDIAAGVRVQQGDALRYRTTFRQATFNRFYGHIAPTDVQDLNRTSSIGLLQNFGEIFFVNPAIRMELKNSYGIPFTLLLDGAGFVTQQDDIRLLRGARVQQPQFIAPPSIDSVGTYKRSSILVHAQNSNIAQILSSLVRLVHIPIHIHLNPAPPFQQFDNHFYTDESKVEMRTRLELPLEVVFEDLIYDMRFLNERLLVDVPDAAKTGVLRLRTLNTLPVEGIVTFSFMKDGEVIYRIPKEKKIKAPTMREDGTVLEPHENMIALPLDVDELHEYKQADETRVRFEFATPTNAQGERLSAAFYASDALVMQLSVRVNTSFE